MLYSVLNFLLSEVDAILKRTYSGSGVAFPKLGKDAPILNTSKLTLLLVNLEEEKIVSAPNRYVRIEQNGTQSTVSPPLKLELSILFAAKFNDYPSALKNLSIVIQFFQTNTVFKRQNFPNLPDEVDHLQVEFQSMTNTQKNEIWNSLKIAYVPSVVYKVKMLVYQDVIPSISAEIKETKLNLNQK